MGIIGMSHAALYLYMYLADSYASTYGLAFNSWFTATRSTAFLFAMAFSFTEVIFWLVSYADTVTASELLYFWSQINVYFYWSAYWLAALFNIIWIGTRTCTGDSCATDWSVTLFI